MNVRAPNDASDPQRDEVKPTGMLGPASVNGWTMSSVPTSVAVYWGEELGRRVGDAARKSGVTADHYMMNSATAEEQLQALAAATDKLAADFGKWNTPWGDINRFQRLTGDIVQPFSDSGPSLPVGFTSARWGSLASFGARLTWMARAQVNMASVSASRSGCSRN